jgi:hypothetical protein
MLIIHSSLFVCLTTLETNQFDTTQHTLKYLLLFLITIIVTTITIIITLGEMQLVEGVVRVAGSVAYCDLRPWILNTTVKVIIAPFLSLICDFLTLYCSYILHLLHTFSSDLALCITHYLHYTHLI